MRSFILIIGYAFIAMASNHNDNEQNVMDALVDRFLDKLIDRISNVPIHEADQDETTLASLASPTASRSAALFRPNFASPLAGYSNRPQVQAAAIRGSTMFSAPALSASPMTPMSFGGRHQVAKLSGMSVDDQMGVLAKYGCPPSQLERLALTAVAAQRDPSMRAQYDKVFSSMTPFNQDKVRNVRKAIIAKVAEYETPKGEAEISLDTMPGAIQPLGYWDPFKLGEMASPNVLYYWREAELKNGRVAMLATIGIFAADNGIRPWWPAGKEFVSSVSSHMGANPNVWLTLLVAVGFLEIGSGFPDRSKAPGDLGFDPLGLKPKNEKDLLEMQNKELANARLAMMASMGIIGQELMLGKGVWANN